jgi:hypothetical protein
VRVAFPTLILFLVACTEESPARPDGGPSSHSDAAEADAVARDAEPAETGLPDVIVYPDADQPDAVSPDAEPRDADEPDAMQDAGEVEACQRDQGGPAERGCPLGQVCNLAMNPPQCVAGFACTTSSDCNRCSAIAPAPADCGHGFHVVAFCDSRHGNVCTRSRAPCEPCAVDLDCGIVHPLLGGAANLCLDYANGEKYCGRPCGSCPDGFICDANSSQCRAQSCEANTVFCPPDNMIPPDCSGSDQICPGEECPNTGGAICSTNNQPYTIGTCIGFCMTNADCPPTEPNCNTRNGVCYP